MEAENALERVQSFDPQSLVRREDLGKYAFDRAVEPSRRVVSLFQTLPISHLDYLPDQQVTAVRDTANSFYNLLDKFAEFDVASAEPNVTEAQNQLVTSLDKQFQSAFNQLSPIIAFTTARSQDFAALEQNARAAAQAAKDAAENVVAELDAQKESAESLVSEMRNLAAEQGVSNEAIHFKAEADKHMQAASDWRKYTLWAAGGLGIYAFLSLFFHHIPGLEPTDTYRSVQIAISKFLIFGVIAYVLFLCARNFLSHKHNEIVNRHRQNALATFKTLAEATSDAASSDIVLSHAASCIFSPQETGYTKGDVNQFESVPALQVVPRIGATAGSS